MVNKLKNFLFDSNKRFLYLNALGFYNYLPDEKFIRKMYKALLKKDINLENPQTFNEKLQWIKLNDRKPEYSRMVDKYEVKKYVADIIGEEYIIPNYGVWDKFEDIDFSKLPQQFVLKCTHDSGGLVICKDKSKLDIEKARKKINNALKSDFYYKYREWPYKNVVPRIIAEKFMTDTTESDMIDYKIHCFNGKPKFVLVCDGRFSQEGITEDFYDISWNHMDVKRPGIPNKSVNHPKPEMLEQMLKLAEVLSKEFYFLRVDFYVLDGRIYFGELTFFPSAGFKGFYPEKWDRVFGDWIDLPTNIQ